ncbi:NADPH-dependent FMN reductase [Pseudoxanthomonas dokdonensis]|nr:NAD(P)H-dependent oxidoreductase [Pseudoxanthomonas dokdonensis]
MRILAVSGSSRHDSFNSRLLQAAANCIDENAEVQQAPALASLPHFNEDEEPAMLQSASVRAWIDAVTSSDALMIATPEYNQSIPGMLKNALDWLSRTPQTRQLEGKPVALMGATVGPWGTRLAQAHLRHVLGVIGMQVVGRPLYLAHAGSRHDADSGQWDAPLQAQVAQWSADLLTAIAR